MIEERNIDLFYVFLSGTKGQAINVTVENQHYTWSMLSGDSHWMTSDARLTLLEFLRDTSSVSIYKISGTFSVDDLNLELERNFFETKEIIVKNGELILEEK